VYTRGDCRGYRGDDRPCIYYVNMFNRTTNWRSSRRSVACSVYTGRSSSRRSPRPVASTIAPCIRPISHHQARGNACCILLVCFFSLSDEHENQFEARGGALMPVAETCFSWTLHLCA